ncbi:hypothetical protein CSW23_05250 [Thermus scotoductus]|uniref:Uncharacterized protein n=1 Tax=Thermus scotoductus TaxID=37636 RepID=A0A430V4S7_THESC|nr:hypothetical protein CSW31_07225 [Thermus scotoductus]RTI18086.1 hypothetical protein CSW23_05250 [Thermus scotoductus]
MAVTRIKFVLDEKYELSGTGLVHETLEELEQMPPDEAIEVLEAHFDEEWMAKAYASGFGEGAKVMVFACEIVEVISGVVPEPDQAALFEEGA